MNDISGIKGEYRYPNPGEIDILAKTFRQLQRPAEGRPRGIFRSNDPQVGTVVPYLHLQGDPT
jgi:hypothetical protein